MTKYILTSLSEECLHHAKEVKNIQIDNLTKHDIENIMEAYISLREVVEDYTKKELEKWKMD